VALLIIAAAVSSLAHGYTHAYQISALIISAAVPIAIGLLRLRPGAPRSAPAPP